MTRTPKPTDWHRRPKEGGPRCPICNCPGRTSGEHRAVPAEEGTNSFWMKRRKSRAGWQYTPIGSRHKAKRKTTALGYPPPEPTKWHKKPRGASEKTCPICGYSAKYRGQHRAVTQDERTTGRWEFRGRWVWRTLTANGWEYLAIGVPAKKGSRPRTGARKRTRQQIARAAALQVQGKTNRQIAEAIGVSPRSLFGYKRRYSELWQTAYDHAMGEVVRIVGVTLDTDEILQNRDLYVRRAKAHLRQNSFAVHFYEEFAPDKLQGRSPNTLHQYENAVRKLSSFFGCDVALTDVNEALVNRFGEWLISEGVSSETARKYRAYVSAIVRHVRPDKCLKQRPHEKVAVGVDDDSPEGSVMGCFLGTYCLERLIFTPGTAEQIRIAIRSFSRYLGRHALLSDLTKNTVLSWMRHLAESLAPSTVNSKRQAIIAVWNHAAEHELVPPPHRVPKLRVPKRIPVVWTLPELERIFHAANALTGEWSGVPVSLCWQLFLLLFWDTGSRLGAVLKAKTSQVDLAARMLLVPAEHLKGQREDRLFPLHEQTVSAIARSRPNEREMLFPFPSSHRQIWPHLKAILRAAGLPYDRQHMFHAFRRTAESYAASVKGIAWAASAVGHEEAVARRSYVSPLICRPPALIEALPRPRLDGPNGNGDE